VWGMVCCTFFWCDAHYIANPAGNTYHLLIMVCLVTASSAASAMCAVSTGLTTRGQENCAGSKSSWKHLLLFKKVVDCLVTASSAASAVSAGFATRSERRCTGFATRNGKIEVKVYTGSHQRALRKGSQLVLTLARAPPKDKKEKQQRLLRIRRFSAMRSGLCLALLKPAALPVTPLPDPPEVETTVSTGFAARSRRRCKYRLCNQCQ